MSDVIVVSALVCSMVVVVERKVPKNFLWGLVVFFVALSRCHDSSFFVITKVLHFHTHTHPIKFY